MASNLLDLPHEVLHTIIANADPQDLAALCCCRALNDFIKNNDLLHKQLYLKTFVRNHWVACHIHTELLSNLGSIISQWEHCLGSRATKASQISEDLGVE